MPTALQFSGVELVGNTANNFYKYTYTPASKTTGVDYSIPNTTGLRRRIHSIQGTKSDVDIITIEAISSFSSLANARTFIETTIPALRQNTSLEIGTLTGAQPFIGSNQAFSKTNQRMESFNLVEPFSKPTEDLQNVGNYLISWTAVFIPYNG